MCVEEFIGCQTERLNTLLKIVHLIFSVSGRVPRVLVLVVISCTIKAVPSKQLIRRNFIHKWVKLVGHTTRTTPFASIEFSFSFMTYIFVSSSSSSLKFQPR